MIIKNGMVFTEDKTFVTKDLYIEDGKIVEYLNQVSDLSEVDAKGLYVLPGLIDIHSHGAVGYDCSDGDMEGLHEIIRYQVAHGITGYVPTTMSLPKERLLEVVKSLGEAENPHILGIHMEGPFLDIQKAGAHRKEYLCKPELDFIQACREVSGNRIRLLTLAPNLEGAEHIIRENSADFTISLGHTSADYETCMEAFAAGATHVTHLFNAMNPWNHREPGLIGAAMDSHCMVELIADGVHVHESVVRMVFRMFPERVVLISDSMRATGLGDGTYELGGQAVKVSGKYATLEDGTIAGSVTNLFDAMKNAVSFGVPFEEAVAAATINPAKVIGADVLIGSLAPGKYADALLVNKELELVRVIERTDT